MTVTEQAGPLRIFTGESDRWHGSPLHEAIVLAARGRRLAGASVPRGPMSPGGARGLHAPKVLRLSEGLPIVIEIVESREDSDRLLPHFEQTPQGGPATLADARVIRNRGLPEEDA